MKRRQFLAWSAGSLALSQQRSAVAQSPTSEETDVTLLAWLPEGLPLPESYLTRLYFLDLQEEPQYNPRRRTVVPGKAISQAPQWPCAIALQMPVQGFGEVTLYADNQGRGFTPSDFPLTLNRAFARDRIHRVQTALTTWQRVGHRVSPTIAARLERARALWQQAEQTDALPEQVQLWNESLVESLWAGEESAIARAQQRIQQRPPRINFRFGSNFFGHPAQGESYDRYFRQLFNYATVPLYWSGFEPTPGQPQYGPVDEQVNWLRQAGITPKGHPLVWFHEASVPDWIRGKPYGEVRSQLQQRIQDITRHYGSQIPIYDVINEAHEVPWSNELNLSPNQFLELTRMACETVRQGFPQAQRILNNCCLWAENVAYFGPPQRSPYRYLQTCLEANIPFEVIGLQLYYPDQDMFEIDRRLDRFISLGKPIHITEMAASSQTGIDEQSLLEEAVGLWHGPWSEAIQADWAEQIYTLAYSKPEIQAVTWWDFSDVGGFWPFGGLLNRELQPKQAFYRLQSLLQDWQIPHTLKDTELETPL